MGLVGNSSLSELVSEAFEVSEKLLGKCSRKYESLV
jgi:hypothetical protein